MDPFLLMLLASDARYVHAFLIKLMYTGFRPKVLHAPWDAYLMLLAMLTSMPLEYLLIILMGDE